MIDATDRKILNLLAADSRQSMRELATKSGVSAATVMKRLHTLEKEKIISAYTVTLDLDKLGYDIPVIIDLRISKGKLFQVEKKIASHTNVTAVYDTTGSFDATIIASFKSRRSMDYFLKQIQAYDFVERTQTRLILNTIKDRRLHVD